MDSVLSALADRDRRRVLRHFVETGEAVASVDELAGRLVAADGDGGRAAASIALHHVVLPHLADAGFVEYDPRSRVARYRPSEPVERTLRAVTAWEATA